MLAFLVCAVFPPVRVAFSAAASCCCCCLCCCFCRCLGSLSVEKPNPPLQILTKCLYCFSCCLCCFCCCCFCAFVLLQLFCVLLLLLCAAFLVVCLAFAAIFAAAAFAAVCPKILHALCCCRLMLALFVMLAVLLLLLFLRFTVVHGVATVFAAACWFLMFVLLPLMFFFNVSATMQKMQTSANVHKKVQASAMKMHKTNKSNK